MTAKAHVRLNPIMDGIDIALSRDQNGGRSIVVWPEMSMQFVPREEATATTENAWLPLQEDFARALYEALGDHFGHAGHDMRALRKDYDAERQRVDKLIDLATRPPIIINHDLP